jgi:hypothetical protein
MIRAVAATLAASAAYGFALGSAHSERYAVNNLLKFPLLIAVTAAVCALSYWLVARLFAVPLSFAAVQAVAGRLFQGAAILLASLAPVTFFVARVIRATDDGNLGEYDHFLSLNILAVGVAGTLALLRQASGLLREQGLSRARSAAVVLSWLTLSLGVGGQAAFVMRPFFGFPATRGNVPPLFLGSRPDVRGARNFYEAAWQTIRRPPLPAKWPKAR